MIDAGRDPTSLLILDMCVLVDYIKAEPGLLKIIAGEETVVNEAMTYIALCRQC